MRLFQFKSEVNVELVSKILQAVLEAALPILAAALATWVTGKAIEIFKKVKDKNPELYEILKVVCREAVTAAEQVYGTGEGKKKLEYAINFVEKYLAAKGIKLDIDIILGYIEAAVKDMNDYGMPYEYEIDMLDDEKDDKGGQDELSAVSKETQKGIAEQVKTEKDKGKAS